MTKRRDRDGWNERKRGKRYKNGREGDRKSEIAIERENEREREREERERDRKRVRETERKR